MANTVVFGGLTTGSTTAADTAETRCGFVMSFAPRVADLVSVVAASLPANGALTIVTQPDETGRKLQIRIVDVDASISAGIVTIIGVDPSGLARTETASLVGGGAGTTLTTTWVYATITSATISGLVGAGVGDTVGIGVGASLGLVGCKSPTPGTFAVFKATIGGIREVIGTVDATAGSITPTTAPNGVNSYGFSYTYIVTPTQSAHTHDSFTAS